MRITNQVKRTAPKQGAQSRLLELEGLRGLAAFWVFALHVSILSGSRIPIVSSGALGVDLFIIMSGFLMVHTYEERKNKEPWTHFSTARNFWLRRFFRVAPLYYPTVLLSILASAYYGGARAAIGTRYATAATEQLRYSDHSLANVVSHLTFAFGALPQFAFKTPLPDWSIGLEMQFYLIFPLFMMLVARTGYKWAVTLLLGVASVGAFTAPHFYSSFTMPSFLPLKINLFCLGMLLAVASRHSQRLIGLIWVVALPLLGKILWRETDTMMIAKQIIVGLFVYAVTVWVDHRNALLLALRRVLNAAIPQKLGELSYSIYLVHLLVVLPVSAALVSNSWFGAQPGVARFAMSMALNTLLVLPTSALLYRSIERPGIQLGKKVISGRAVSGRAAAPPASVEAPAASLMQVGVAE